MSKKLPFLHDMPSISVDNASQKGYISLMFETIEYNRAAFKHNINEEDIRWAFFHYLYDGPMENMENKYIRIGFNRVGNLLEIMYNEIDEHTVNIFHAMECRSIYYPLLNR